VKVSCEIRNLKCWRDVTIYLFSFFIKPFLRTIISRWKMYVLEPPSLELHRFSHSPGRHHPHTQHSTRLLYAPPTTRCLYHLYPGLRNRGCLQPDIDIQLSQITGRQIDMIKHVKRYVCHTFKSLLFCPENVTYCITIFFFNWRIVFKSISSDYYYLCYYTPTTISHYIKL